MKKILIVDDNAQMRRLLNITLNSDYDIIEACDGEDALAKVLSQKPDAVLLDVMMPGHFDGLEVLDMIKKDPLSTQTLVAMVTARSLPSDWDNFVAALMSNDTIVGPPLSDLVFGMVYIRNGISIEPIHQALATIVASRKARDAAQVQMRDEKMAFITACRAEKAADGALKFLVELQTLIEFAK